MGFGFPKRLLSSLVCQKDGGSLKTSESSDWVQNGLLKCQMCGITYEVKDGIVDMLRGNPGLDDLMKAEITARDAATPDYDRKLASRREKEIPTTLRTLGGVAGKKIIDYGCGTGRLTVELFDADLVLAADFSRRSLEMLALKSNGRRNLGLVLADVSSFRTAPKFFDKAISAQVLEHITSPEKRKNFFNLVWETLKPNGVFVLS